MTVIVRSATDDAITIPLRLMNALKLREGDEVKAIVDGETLRLAHLDQFLSLRGALANDEVKAIVDGETLRLAHLDQFLSLRGALANDEGFDEALKASEQAWQTWTKTKGEIS
jgi:hypothetical protein